MLKILEGLFGNAQKKELEKLQKKVDEVNNLEEEISKLSDEELKEKTNEFKKRLKKKEVTLDKLLPETFAVAREAGKRVIGQRAYDSQLMGGIILHQGKIAEMKTGEGKTLASVLAGYLNALTEKGVHVISVNDYLSKRDANWMGSIYHFLGLSVACILHDSSFLYQPKTIDENEVTVEEENLEPIERREAYKADILYGTNNEFGFDYLRDNMAQSMDHLVQRPHNFAIVDEVDSILIDESRTPLIISAPDNESTAMYSQFASLVPRLKENEDYNIDEKLKSAMLTAEGIAKIEKWLGIGNIYETSKISYVHHLEQALKAQILFKLDRDYVVKDGEVQIVDEFTGRLMPGRRYSEGLHQAIEAKENVKVQRESRTLATITFQNYFRIYKKLSGMTGTAMTSAEELFKVYELEVTSVPTNREMVRDDMADMIYKTEEGKFRAIIEDIVKKNKAGRPILVGTIAIEKSEYLSALLTKRGVTHEVLNAKNHEREAQIIARAGEKGSVTIATNMAGRGTDIKITDEVKSLGGLHILGSERHEARRIDNQLRGRAGRQGDSGSSQFFVSLEDELMRRFGGDKMQGIMNRLGLPEDQPIENKIISKSIESAQGKIEGYNFDIRKRVLEYDDVMNKQRETIYKKRRGALERDEIEEQIKEILTNEVDFIAGAHVAFDDEDQWDTEEIIEEIETLSGVKDSNLHKDLIDIKKSEKDTLEKRDSLTRFLEKKVKEFYREKESEIGAKQMRVIEKSFYLRTIDNFWMDHLEYMDHVREGIGLQGYGQRDPLIMYKKEAFTIFQSLLENINKTTISTLFKIQTVTPGTSATRKEESNLSYSGGEEIAHFSGNNSSTEAQKENAPQEPIVSQKKANRNDPCPCGSGKKYKKCCGKS